MIGSPRTTANSPRMIDLNADLGEGCPWDEPLLALVTSASVCCGAHAGDNATISATIRSARACGVIVGAHPGYADRAGFGRREQAISSEQVERLILDQTARLAAIAANLGTPLRFLKPHGALYNQAQRDESIALGVTRAARIMGLPILGQPQTQVARLASQLSVRFVAEGFADRRYASDGRLVPRDQPGAILEDSTEIAAQVRWLVESGIETVCIHGDNPHSVELARHVRQALEREGIALRPFVT